MSELITQKDVQHVAKLARLRLSDEEAEQFTAQLGAILEHAAQVRALDTEGVAPTAHPIPMVNVLRADDTRACLDRDEVLAAAPAAQDDRFRVPRIMDAP